MKDDARSPKHQHEHEIPTVIHSDADETILAQWLRQALERGPVFWGLLGGVVLVIALVVFLFNSLSGRVSPSAEAWEDLMLAQDPEDRAKVADEATGPAKTWALIQAAESNYTEAFNMLPDNRDGANPLLTKAFEQFEDAYKLAPENSVQKRLAAMGMARTEETRGKISEAIEQYKLVAEKWPKSHQGLQADQLIRELQKTDNEKFYESFSQYRPSEVTLPPRSDNRFDLPAGHPDVNGPIIPAPGFTPSGTTGVPASPSSILPPLRMPTPSSTEPEPIVTPSPEPEPVVTPSAPPSGAPMPEPEAAVPTQPSSELPDDLFSEEEAAPKAESRASETPAAEPSRELPSEPFVSEPEGSSSRR